MIKTGDRFGVLEVQEIGGGMYYTICLVHAKRRTMRLTAIQLQTATQCPGCCSDNAERHKQAANLTGQTFGDYVAIKIMGLSIGAATVKRNQKQWQGKAKLNYNTYNRNKYWLCYCRYCYKEHELRGDVLCSKNVPKCGCERII